MKQFIEKRTGYSATVDNEKLTIEIPISTLVNAFNCSPDNYGEATVRKGKRQEFAEFLAKHISDEIDQETGASYLTEMLDKMFSSIFDGEFDIPDIVKFQEE